MASETSGEQRGGISSFSQKLESGLRPLSQAFLDWAEKTVTSYPQLKGVVKAMKIDRLLGPGAYPPEAEVQAKMDAVKATAARRHAESHRLHFLLLAASVGSVAVAAIYGWLQESGILNNADVSAIDNQPMFTEAAPAEAVDVFTATPTQIPPTEIFIPATATLTETPTLAPTASQTAAEKPPSVWGEWGRIERLDCRGLTFDECYKKLIRMLEPLLDEDWGDFRTEVIPTGDKDPLTGEPVVTLRDISLLKIVELMWDRPDGWSTADKPDYILAFGIQERGKPKVIQPAVPILSSSVGPSAVGKITTYSPEVPDRSGVTFHPGISSAQELADDFHPGETVHRIHLLNKSGKDPVGAYILNFGDPIPDDRIKAIGLVSWIEKKNPK